MNKKYAPLKVFFFLLILLGIQSQANSQNLIPLRKGFQWGYIDTTKQIVIPVQFEEALLFKYGLAHVRQNGKWGVIDTKGKWILSAKFDHLYRLENGLISATEVDGKTIFNKKGELIFPKGRWKISSVGNIGVFSRSGKSDLNIIAGKEGIINSDGTIIVHANKYKKITLSKNKNYIESQLDPIINNNKLEKSIGLFDLNGNFILPPQYATIKNLSLDRWLVGSTFNKRFPSSIQDCEIVNNKNQHITNKKFDRGSFISNLNLIILTSDNKSGIFDLNGKNVFGKMFDYLEVIDDNVFIAGNNNKCSLYNFKTGKINKLIFEKPQGLRERRLYKNLMLFSVDGQYGIINLDGKILIQPAFDYIDNLKYFDENGFFTFTKNKLYGIADLTGKIIINPSYRYIDLGPNHTAILEKDRENSLMDFEGKTIIPFGKYNLSLITSDTRTKNLNLLSFQIKKNDGKNKLYGLMNTKGEILIPPKYTEINRFYNNHLTVFDYHSTNRQTSVGVVSKEGKELIDPSDLKYFRINILTKGKFEFWERDLKTTQISYKIGHLDDDGKLKLLYDFRIKEELANGYFIGFNSEGMHGLLDSNFQVLIPFNFQSLYLAGSYRIYGYKPENRRLHIFDSNFEYQFPPIYDRVNIKIEYDSLFEAVLSDVIVGYFDKNKKSYFSDSDIENYINHFLEKKNGYDKIIKIEKDKYLKRIKGHPARFKSNECEKINDLSEKHKCAEQALEELLSKKIQESKTSIKGTVKTSFTITENGSIEKIRILKSDNQDLNEIAITIIKSLPLFIPTRSYEENISTRKILKLNF